MLQFRVYVAYFTYLCIYLTYHLSHLFNMTKDSLEI